MVVLSAQVLNWLTVNYCCVAVVILDYAEIFGFRLQSTIELDIPTIAGD